MLSHAGIQISSKVHEEWAESIDKITDEIF